MWRSGHTDLARLLRNSIRWVAGANPPVTIKGDGVIETFAWETQAGFAVHILNYTNPAMHRGWIRNFYPIGAQKVRMSLPQGRRVTRVGLLRAETSIPFIGGIGKIEFTIPKVLDYEVAALYSTRSTCDSHAATTPSAVPLRLHRECRPFPVRWRGRSASCNIVPRSRP